MKKRTVKLRSRAVLPGVWLACLAAGELAIAQLPPTILADRYLVQAARELDTGDAAAAVETLSRIVALEAEHGLEIPDVFWFRRAEAAHEAGLQDLALESIIRYFDISGQGGEHYLAALELYDAAELAKQVAAERAAAEAERATVVAAAVAAAIPEMVAIPPGRFRMGCVSGQDCHESEFPVHDVTIPEAFEVSKFEVTFAQWDACVWGGGCGGFRPSDRGWGRGTRPVFGVSLQDALAFVSWLSLHTGEDYRLLSEAEWEYVARAGTETAYSWGDDIGSNRATCHGCGSQLGAGEYAVPVGSFEPNAFGVYDMHGNVAEWVADCWNPGYAGAPADGSAWRRGNCEYGVWRGGGAWSYPDQVRAAHRATNNSGDRGLWNGFRVARTLTP